MKRNLRSQSGQVGIIIILTMTVLLTVGLSAASRTSQDLSLSTQDKESARVFNAAEAGIEEALSSDLDLEGDSITGSLGTIADSEVSFQIDKSRNLETKLFEGISSKIALDGVSNGDQLIIDWSKENNCDSQSPAALLVTIFYDDGGLTRVRNYAYGSCSEYEDNMDIAGAGEGGYFKRATVSLTENDLFAHVKAVYNDTDIRVSSSGWTLPVQAFRVRSEASSSLGQESRIVEVEKGLDTAPTVIDYALVSGTNLIK